MPSAEQTHGMATVSVQCLDNSQGFQHYWIPPIVVSIAYPMQARAYQGGPCIYPHPRGGEEGGGGGGAIFKVPGLQRKSGASGAHDTFRKLLLHRRDLFNASPLGALRGFLLQVYHIELERTARRRGERARYTRSSVGKILPEYFFSRSQTRYHVKVQQTDSAPPCQMLPF